MLSLAIILFAFFGFGRSTFAEDYQICRPNQNCLLGEFLYDDDYDPIKKDVCEVTIVDPTGKTVVDDEGTTFDDEDGWHQYIYSTSGPEGFYRATLCCKSGGDEICADKSFILESVQTSTSVTPSKDPDSATKEDLELLETSISDKIDSLPTQQPISSDSMKESSEPTKESPSSVGSNDYAEVAMVNEGEGSIDQENEEYWSQTKLLTVVIAGICIVLIAWFFWHVARKE